MLIQACTVLGGQKISGADIRDQNGTAGKSTDASDKLRLDSPRDPGHSKCRQELLRSVGSRQDDGGRHRSKAKLD